MVKEYVEPLLRSFLEVGDKVAPFLALLQTSVCHFGTRNVLLGVFKVLKKRIFIPCNSFADVGSSVRVSLGLSSLATEESVEVGTSLMRAASLNSVTLTAAIVEKRSTLFSVSGSVFVVTLSHY